MFDGVDVAGDGAVASIAEVITWNDTVQRGVSINTANVTGGTVLATSSESATAGGPVIAEYAAGASVNNGEVLAGPRMFFMSGTREADGVTSETAGIFDLTSVGETMFLNSVNYMAAVPEPSSALLGLFGFGLLPLIRRRRS